MNRFGKPWKINPGDGAFYGPKIDIKVCDALKREHQLGTIQLDFNLPIRFNLQYRGTELEGTETEKSETEKSVTSEKTSESKKGKKEKKGKEDKEGKEEKDVEKKSEESAQCEHTHAEHASAKAEEETKSQTTSTATEKRHGEHHHLKPGFQRPVMIHRAVLGSVERMLAILCEHTGGKWPFWLSPRQVKVIPISEKFIEYAEAVYERLKLEGYAAELDRTNFTINKKVRNAQVAQFNFIAVVGEEELKTGSVDLRERDNKDRLVRIYEFFN